MIIFLRDSKYLLPIVMFSLWGISMGATYFTRKANHNRKPIYTDLNRDGITDSLDMQLVYNRIGSNCDGCIEDLNKDYEVDGNDVLLVLANTSSH